MPQGVLPFQYEEEKTGNGMTALAGLPLYLEMAEVAGLPGSIRRHMQVAGSQGWDDVQVVLALVLLQLAGGEAVEDLGLLEHDAGFAAVLRRLEEHGLSRRQRAQRDGRWRKPRVRTVPSPSAVLRYLAACHDPEQELAHQGWTTIPAPTAAVQGLLQVNRDLVAWVQRCRPQRVATLDMDATLIESHKQQALWCYKHYPAYQPLNTYWAEQGVTLDTEFRDGKSPQATATAGAASGAGPAAAGSGAGAAPLGHGGLPAGTAALLCRREASPLRRHRMRGGGGRDASLQGRGRRGGPPGLAALGAGGGWAAPCHGPGVGGGVLRAQLGRIPQDGPEYRFLAVREPLVQRPLPGLEEQLTLPFPTITLQEQRYQLHGVVTNRDLPGDVVIWWLRERCGKGEEIHKILKEDLAGGVLPSGRIGPKAAWWAITVLAANLHLALQRLVLGPSWLGKRLVA